MRKMMTMTMIWLSWLASELGKAGLSHPDVPPSSTFIWALEIRIQVLTLAEQGLYPPKRLPAPCLVCWVLTAVFLLLVFQEGFMTHTYWGYQIGSNVLLASQSIFCILGNTLEVVKLLLGWLSLLCVFAGAGCLSKRQGLSILRPQTSYKF